LHCVWLGLCDGALFAQHLTDAIACSLKLRTNDSTFTVH
jgi:hypothetical protein